jgi:hypothetical protein
MIEWASSQGQDQDKEAERQRLEEIANVLFHCNQNSIVYQSKTETYLIRVPPVLGYRVNSQRAN